jgi:D-alanyl-D-alanine carboxypeptidase
LRKAIEEIVDSGFLGVPLRVPDDRGEWVGSNTKTFPATLVLLLVADGKAKLDTPVAAYLPEPGLD